LLYIRIYSIFYRNDIEELKKIHGPKLEDPTSVPFNVEVAYATGGAPHMEGSEDIDYFSLTIVSS
jgi:hypothetical protein